MRSGEFTVTPAIDKVASGPDMRSRIERLFPPKQEVIGILGVIVFAVHSWSIRGFLYSLPSFILKYRPDEILAVFCYHMAFALLESVCAMALLLVLGALLPAAWLRSGFIYKSFVIFMAGCAAAIFLQYSYVSEAFVFEGPGRGLFLVELAGGLAAFIGIYVACVRMVRLQKVVSSLVDRISIMLFIYLPLDAIGLLVVSLRLLR
jgi:hypothetical protein